jgi:nucleosome binding factor SPN SPT16 subunit
VLKKFLVNKIEEVVDGEQKITHTALADLTDEVFQKPELVKSKLRADNLDSCYTPIIQSGGKFDLKPSAESDEETMHYGTIICVVGGRYKNYCANVGRTYLINPTQDQKETYELLIKAYTACKENMKPGKKVCDVYNAALDVIKKRKPDLVDNFTKNVGCGIGLEFREASLVMTAKNTRVLKAGMMLNLCLGFSDVATTDEERKKNPKTATYALLLADTVMVTVDEPETLTHMARGWAEVIYTIGDEEEEEESSDEEDKRVRGIQKGNLREDADRNNTEKSLKDNQKALAEKKRDENLRRLAEAKIGGTFKSQAQDVEINSYKSQDDFPERARPNHIFVDGEAESVLLPIQDQMVPFHIATIKNVQKSEAGNDTLLSITFSLPGQQGLPSVADPKKFFIRELTFKSNSSGNMGKAFFDIKELRKRFLSRLKEHEMEETTVKQEDLLINKQAGPIAKLRDVVVRPNLSRKKATGIVTAHQNGLRYTGQGGEKLDVIYKNIKQAFFQPAQNSANVMLHFELHNGIIIDPKKSKRTNYVQFLVEVVESSQDLDKAHRNNDEDGLLEEQDERRKRSRTNKRFHEFVTKVTEELDKSRTQPKIEFDIPYRELVFTGVPNKSSVEIMPTVHSLVALEDSPPVVLSLEDIEIANFERVQFQLRNFDLSFVFKDFNRQPVRIDAIPMKSLEALKTWLNNCGIVFYETKSNLVWKKMLKEISKDLEGFYEDGGWNTILGEESGDEEEGDEESESEFEPDAEEEGDDSEEYLSDEESDGEDDDDSEASDEDEGEDWDVMERKAKDADREQNVKEREDDKAEARRPSSSSREAPPAKKSSSKKPSKDVQPSKKAKR